MLQNVCTSMPKAINPDSEMNRVREGMLTMLRNALGKALRSMVMYKALYPNLKYDAMLSKQGGKVLKELIKKGLIKQLLRGYYQIIPQ